MSKTLVRIGIDPDLKASGFCVLTKTPFKNGWVIEELETLSFFSLIQNLEVQTKLAQLPGTSLLVCIEAGWLNKSIHHFAANKSVAGKIGKNVGHNEAIGKLFEEWCKENNVPYKLIKPETKKWDADLFKKVTGWDKRTNQEERDAVRTAWN